MSSKNKYLSESSQQTIYLSRIERRIGGQNYLRFNGMNGLATTFLGDSTVALLAIRFGADNLELGLISGMLYISGIILLITPRLLKGMNVVKVAAWSIFLRGLFSFGYVALFRLQGKQAVMLILLLYTLFCLARTVGLSMIITLQKRLMDTRSNGENVFRAAGSFFGQLFISRLISYGVLSLRYLSALSGLLLLQGLGIVTNTISAIYLTKIPNRTTVEYRKGENIFHILLSNLKMSQERRILFLRWISIGQLILFSMTVPLLSRSAGFKADQIFIFTIAVALAAFLSCMSMRSVIKQTGSRPLLFFISIPTMLLFLAWIFIPVELGLSVFVIVGFVTMFFLNASSLTIQKMLIDITPDDKSVSFTAMVTFSTSILAVILSIGVGYLGNFSLKLKDSMPINDYGLVFLPGFLGAFFQIILTVRVSEPDSTSLREMLYMITNIGNLKAWQTLNNLEKAINPVKRRTLLHTMGQNKAPIASNEIKKILAEPLSFERGELIDTLFFHNRPSLVDFLCDEALEPSSYHRLNAIFALGSYPGQKPESVLEKLLFDDNPRIQAAAAKSLGRIGSDKHLEIIYERWKNEKRLHAYLDYMICLFRMDPEKRYITDVFITPSTLFGERGQQTIFTLLAQQFLMLPTLSSFYRDENLSSGYGVKLLLDEARNTQFMLANASGMLELWYSGHYREIWEMCQRMLKSFTPVNTLIPLYKGLLACPPDNVNRINTLACIYFSYQILTAEMGGIKGHSP